MELDQIKQKANKLNEDLRKIGQRRLFWKQKTRELIFDTFTKVNIEANLNCYIQKIDEIKNQEFVNIHFKKRDSGIVSNEIDDKQKKSRTYFIEGGYLTYSQGANGKVYVVISYPHIRDFGGKINNLPLGFFEPNEINEELIFKHIDLFLDEMIKWQNNHLNGSVFSQHPSGDSLLDNH